MKEMPKGSLRGFTDVAAAKAEVEALEGSLAVAQASLKKAKEDSLKRLRHGETSGDVIEDALLVGDRVGDAEIEKVLRVLHERLLDSEGELFMFGHHQWNTYDDSSDEQFEHPPSSFKIGFVPKGGLKISRPYDEDQLVIHAGWNIKVTPHYFEGTGSFASWPFQDWNLDEFVEVPVGGWKKYPPILLVGQSEIQRYYAEDDRFAGLVLALKSGKSGIKNKEKFESLRADTRSKLIIEALPLPALVLA